MAGIFVTGLILLFSSSTVLSVADFDPASDSIILKNALDNLNSTNQKVIIDLITHRSREQRDKIFHQHQTLYQLKLLNSVYIDVKELLRYLLVPRTVLNALMFTQVPHLTRDSHLSLASESESAKLVALFVCAKSNSEMLEIKRVAQEYFKLDLVEFLPSFAIGYFKDLLSALASAKRDESSVVNSTEAIIKASELYTAGEGNLLGTDEDVFISILTRTNTAQLKKIFSVYRSLYKHSIETAIGNEFSGNIELGLLTIVKWAKNKAGFFAQEFYNALHSDDEIKKNVKLVYLVADHSEIDMKEIKDAYKIKYGKNLEDDISVYISEDVKNLVLPLVK